MDQDTLYQILMLAKILLWLAMVGVFARSKQASIYHPFLYYLIFDFIVFTMRAPLIYFRDYSFVYNVYMFQPSMGEKTTALLATMVALAVFGATNLSVAKTPIVFRSRIIEDAKRTAYVKPVLIVAAVLAPLGIYSLYTSWSAGITGVSTMVMDSATGVAINTESNGYVFEARNMLGTVAILCAWVGNFSWISCIPTAIFAVLSAGVSKRGVFVVAMIGLALIWLYQNRRTWPKRHWLIWLALAMALFSAAGEDRGRSVRGLFVEEQAELYRDSRAQEQQFMEGMDFANLEYLEYLVYVVPERSGTYGYFLDNLQIFTEPVPRALWKSKPIGEPFPLISIFKYGNPVGMTRSVAGEGWFNLGFIGVAIWSGLFGLLWGLFYEGFARGTPSNTRMLTYLVLLPLSILFYRDGVALTILRFGIFLVAPTALLHLLTRRVRVRLAPGKLVQGRT